MRPAVVTVVCNVNGKVSSLTYLLLLVTKWVTEITRLDCVDIVTGNFGKEVPLCFFFVVLNRYVWWYRRIAPTCPYRCNSLSFNISREIFICVLVRILNVWSKDSTHFVDPECYSYQVMKLSSRFCFVLINLFKRHTVFLKCHF